MACSPFAEAASVTLAKSTAFVVSLVIFFEANSVIRLLEFAVLKIASAIP